ncbi:MAG TPA: hypothetical protein VK766_12265 [Cytophagaceae bacterium]|nr:hypothetical protein [Cytophagaceae bacterium]
MVLSYSCKREISVRGTSEVNLLSKHPAEVLMASAGNSDETITGSAILLTEKMEDKKVLPVLQNRDKRLKKIVPKENDKKSKGSIKENGKTKKEMHPSLARALVMTIAGGLGVAIGIALYSFASTGLLIFAFSIILIVGLVSLIMYLASPKPKM